MEMKNSCHKNEVSFVLAFIWCAYLFLVFFNFFLVISRKYVCYDLLGLSKAFNCFIMLTKFYYPSTHNVNALFDRS